MANAKLSLLGTQCTANAAAVATALAGGIVTSDVTALGAMLAAIASTNPALMMQMINTTGGPGGTSLTTQLTPA